MKHIQLIIVCTALMLGCKSVKITEGKEYQMNDYVAISQQFSSMETPYVIDLKKGNKRLVFIGCSHTRDTTSSEFTIIEKYFNDLQPQVTFNEGGQIPAAISFQSRNDAITRKGETGLLKYLSDKASIQMLNGDISDSLEFALTLKEHPRDDLFLYYMMERFVVPYLNNAYGNKPFEELYSQVMEAWFIKPGFPLSEDEKRITYFKQLYQKKIGRPFVLEVNEDNFEKFDYINGGDCKFCAIGRTSKKVRDIALLEKIDKAFDRYDRVMVTFGHGHALAIEPALKQILEKTENK
ncbi:hypothetical protein [Pontibacter arcticus]|uniref:Uncharacterized protein n=1 Tax=Pontibacter arcticus TaxID=2080288 RepID=A0A364RF22_9BACT|nr:hypothetical protein [Pontibacter arcticus]RAU82872.1 hypothetical protein DP923_06375 [Pontibacter arcticus]